MEWGSIDDTDYINLGGVDFQSDVEWKKEIELIPNGENLLEVRFEHFFPSAKPHYKLINQFYSSQRSPS